MVRDTRADARASRAASGLFSTEAGYTAADEATHIGTVVGGVSGASGAIASDVMSKVAAQTSGDRYVRDFQNQSLAGPMGWLTAGMGGAMLGGLFGRLFGRLTSTANDLDALREETATSQGATPPTAQVSGHAETVATINGKPIKPSHYGTVYDGDRLTPSEVEAAGGLRRKAPTETSSIITRRSTIGSTTRTTRRCRGGTTQLVTPDVKRGAVHWAPMCLSCEACRCGTSTR